MNESNPIYVLQTRKGTFKDDGSVLYSIVTTVRINTGYSGDIRDAEYLLNVFVNNIVSEDDVLQDTFSNYATIADLDLLPTDRQEAIARGITKYRDSVNTVSFDNLSVATTAAKLVRDTINNLVDTYLRVKQDFIGTDTHYFPYPEEVSSLREQYIAAYKAARDARLSAEETQDISQYDYDLAEAVRVVRSECEQMICSIAEKLTGMATLAQIVGNKYVTTVLDIIDTAESEVPSLSDNPSLVSDLKSFIENEMLTLSLVYDDNPTSIVDSTGTGLSLLAGITQVSYEATTNCSTAASNLAAAQTNKDAKLSELKNNQAIKEAASQAEEAALAQLTTYCPNLDPATI